MYDQALRLFKQHLPRETFRAQPPGDWCGLDPLPPDIAAYYERVGPDNIELPQFANPELPRFANPMYLPPLRDLWLYQEPHQFNIGTWQREPIWHDGWFFLAALQNDEYGHLVLDSSSGRVLKVIYGETGWVAIPLFRDLETMALALAILVTPVSEPQVSTRHEADVHAILAQLRDFLSPKKYAR